MTYKQSKMLDFLEESAARFAHNGYTDLARVTACVAKHLRCGDTVFAVVIASYRLGPDFVEKLRRIFRVGRFE